MFTGIVQGTGVITGAAAPAERGSRDLRMGIRWPERAAALALGESVAVSGVCLTVDDLREDGFAADVSAETLACTTLGSFRTGTRVNLESALTLETPLGGHLVSGHVDATGEVVERVPDGRSVRLAFEAPAALSKYIAPKGSICIDGVSLTVNEVAGTGFRVNIVPHTLDATTLGEFNPGRRVNLEVDVVARYLERLLQDRGTI